MQHLEEQAHVLEVEARRRLVEDVEGAAGVAFGQLGGQFDALRLAPRERRGGLAQVDVSQSYVVEQLEFRADARLVLRSEEHTSELQSRLHLVCRLLLEKKKNHT